MPAFVGIGDQTRVGPCLPYGAHALRVAWAAELQLEKREVWHRACRGRHGLWRIEAQCIAGEHRLEGGKAGNLSGPPARTFRLQIP